MNIHKLIALLTLLLSLVGANVVRSQGYGSADVNRDALIANEMAPYIAAAREERDARVRVQNEWLLNRAEEARAKKSKHYAVVYMDPNDLSRFFWAVGHEDWRVSAAAVKRECGVECKLMAVFSNSCGMFAEPLGNSKLENVVFAEDDQPEKAIEKSKLACEAKYGVKCAFYARDPAEAYPAYCVGHRYGVYAPSH